MPREYVNFIGIERVGQDSRLAWIAYKYYAQKDLWVFIYEANRDIIAHPSHVRPGQYIRIPDLDEEYRNLYNPELKQLVDSLAVEYLK
jgi:phage tail protein X